MDSKEIIKFLFGLKVENDRKSSLYMAIQTARYLTGRDIQTGITKLDDTITNLTCRDETTKHELFYENMFSGLIFYLTVLDQIGLLFETNDQLNKKSDGKSSNIELALDIFSSFNKKEKYAIYSLRNSLVHNFGLINIPTNQKKDKHKFNLEFESGSNTITLPKHIWTGDYNDKNDDTSTKINVYNLCNSIEKIITNITNSIDSIIVKISSKEEIYSKFSVRI